MAFAFVFPGQGSQSVGMLAGLAETAPVIASTFAEASAVLGYDLWKTVQEGPPERLNSTECTQPAMLAAGVATWRLWGARGGAEPQVLAGHSLGEFTALVCARSLEFTSAIELVRFRGRSMQEAVPAGSGAMAAILGLDEAQTAKACEEASQDSIVEPVNFNAPGQIVIAGERAAVMRAIEIAKASGAKRAVLLPVSVPAHSRLMRKAADLLSERLESLHIGSPQIRYVSAVDAAAHTEPADIRALLVRQLASPVRWTETVQAIVAEGQVNALIECGPGKVLTGLNRRIIERRADFACLALEDPAAVEAALTATLGATHA